MCHILKVLSIVFPKAYLSGLFSVILDVLKNIYIYIYILLLFIPLLSLPTNVSNKLRET